MKKIVALSATLMIAGTMSAQLTVGGKAGLTYASYGTKIDPEPSSKPDPSSGIGFHLGGYLTYMFSDKIGVRGELLFDSRGQKSTDESTSTSTIFGITTTSKTTTDNKGSLNYIEIPLLFNYQASDAFSLQAGPGIGLLMSAKSNFDSTTSTTTTGGGSSTTSTSSTSGSSTSKDGLRGMELGLCAGAAYQLESGLSFGLRYWRGLSTLNSDTDFGSATVKTHANVIQFSVGYAFIKD